MIAIRAHDYTYSHIKLELGIRIHNLLVFRSSGILLPLYKGNWFEIPY